MTPSDHPPGGDDSTNNEYDARDLEGLLKRARDSWPDSIDGELSVDLAELCRHTFIRCTDAEPQRLAEANLWRARAMSAAIVSGSVRTIAGLMIEAAFRILEIARRENDEGAFDTALLVLDEIPRLVPEGSGDWNQLFGRLYNDKRGTILLFKNPKAAEDLFLSAVSANDPETDPRGSLKARASVALAGYLSLIQGSSAPGTDEVAPYLNETNDIRLAAESADPPYADVAEWASINAKTMGRHDAEGWVPYDVL